MNEVIQLPLSKDLIENEIKNIEEFPNCEIFDCSDSFSRPYFTLEFTHDFLYSGDLNISEKDGKYRVSYDGTWDQDSHSSLREALLSMKDIIEQDLGDLKLSFLR